MLGRVALAAFLCAGCAGDSTAPADGRTAMDGGTLEGGCVYRCSPECRSVCEAFDAGAATLVTLPDIGAAKLTTSLAGTLVAAGAQIHYLGPGYQLLLSSTQGDDAAFRKLGVRLRQQRGRGAAAAASFDLGPLPRAPTAKQPLAFELAVTACDFDLIELYTLEGGEIVAQSPFRNPGEGGTWLCTEKRFIDPYAPCGNARPSEFDFSCR